jgi:hypothetical protein
MRTDAGLLAVALLILVCSAILRVRSSRAFEAFDGEPAPVAPPETTEPTAVSPLVELQDPSLFTIDNPLGLFYPYRTADDIMHITAEQQAAFDAELKAADKRIEPGQIFLL